MLGPFENSVTIEDQNREAIGADDASGRQVILVMHYNALVLLLFSFIGALSTSRTRGYHVDRERFSSFDGNENYIKIEYGIDGKVEIKIKMYNQF